MNKHLHKKLGHITTLAAQGKLYTCRTIPPFDYYKITLDEAKVTIVHKQWFIKHIVTIQLVDLLNVEVIVGPFVGSARIFSKYVTGGEMTIPWFWKKDALKLRTKINEVMTQIHEPDMPDGLLGGE